MIAVIGVAKFAPTGRASPTLRLIKRGHLNSGETTTSANLKGAAIIVSRRGFSPLP